ncbi:M48 family metalloprotease [Sphingomonas sp. MMS24-JH45]
MFAVIRRFRRAWWAIGAGVTIAFGILGAAIAPVFVAPLFNTYSEMPAGPLRDRIVAVARANHIPAEHIYVSDASRQSKRISANVSGIGPTIRITLNDNLLNRTGPDEVVAVMGHEMGHYVLGHVRSPSCSSRDPAAAVLRR